MLPFILALIGFSGITAQLLLLRELLIVFMGNELSIGIILANWLILGAIGAYLFGKIIDRVERKVEAYVIVQVIFALALPIAVYLVRDLRVITGIATGEGFGLLTIVYASFLILLPVSISNGTLFTFGCRLAGQTDRACPNGHSSGRAIGLTYVYETIGAIAGGLAFTYILTPYLHSFQSAIIVALSNLISGLFLIISPQRRRERKGKLFYILCVFCVLAVSTSLYLLFGSGADRIHQASISRQWQPLNVVHYQNSHYGNLVVTKEQDQYTFFSNGLPLITTPVPDIGYVEDFAHLPMLAHPEPKDILVLSGGAGGVINEILKHPSVEKVDYAEIDPLLFELLRKFPTPLSQSELDNPNVHIHNMDGRLFLQKTDQRYDMIFIGVSNPSDLQINRLFTREFLELVSHRCGVGGILVVGLPGSTSYMGEELKKLNACIIQTLYEHYGDYVYIIPGDGLNLFLVRDRKFDSIPTDMATRLAERKLQTGIISAPYIEYRLDRRRLEWFYDNIQVVDCRINEDFLPSAVIYSIGYWNAMFAPEFQKWFRHVEDISLGWLILIIAVLTVIILFLFRLRKGLSRYAIPIALAGTGFTAMVLNLLLIFAFQVVFGYVFHQIGLLITAFMVGIAIGGFVITLYMDKIKRHFQAIIIIEIILIVFIILLPRLQDVQNGIAGQVIFLLCACVGGAIIGAEFPLAVRLYSDRVKDNKVADTAGLLYGADLLGGWLGGIAGGVLFLPVIGFINTLLVIIIVKISTLVILLSGRSVTKK